MELVARTNGWLRYRLPPQVRRRNSAPNFVGQKQIWFLLRMLADDGEVRVDGCAKPEFDHWRWVSYWYPLSKAIDFKREIYRQALTELAPSMRHILSTENADR